VNKESIYSTVINTAKKIMGFRASETTLVLIGWTTFAIGICVVNDPMWKFVVLSVSRVLP